MTFALDSGAPLFAHAHGKERPLSLSTSVCGSPQCETLHLRAVEARGSQDTSGAGADDEALELEWDTRSGQLTGADERSRAWLASERGAWLAPWAEEHAKTLRVRFEQLMAQEVDESPDVRPAPPWSPKARVFHRALYPADFAPAISLRDTVWLIDDACCPDPVFPSSEVALDFISPSGESTRVLGELGKRRPTKATTVGKALWAAVHDDSEVLSQLRARRAEIHLWGSFVVGAAYEKIRLERRAKREEALAPSVPSGLDVDAIPEELLRRLFGVAARLHAVPHRTMDAFSLRRSRVELRGSVTRDAWIEVDPAPAGVALFDGPDDETPWLSLSLGFRDESTLDIRKRRCALGLPLIGGAFVPVVEGARADGTFGPPSADDVGVAVAVVETLLSAEDRAPGHASERPLVIDHRAELDAGPLEVRVTIAPEDVPHPEGDEAAASPADEISEEEADGDDADADDDDDDDDAPLGSVLVAPLVEAFTDAALDRELPVEVLATARLLLDAIACFAFDEGLLLFEDGTWTEFLTSYAPREVFFEDGDIARAPTALSAIADFLGEVGYVDAKRFRASLGRAVPTFQRRARDPRHFSKLKEIHGDTYGLGVDLDDPEAVERFFEMEKLTAPQPSATRAASASKREPSPTRWSPAPGEPRPAPTDPCGCGSGKRYKKCCMPR